MGKSKIASLASQIALQRTSKDALQSYAAPTEEHGPTRQQ